MAVFPRSPTHLPPAEATSVRVNAFPPHSPCPAGALIITHTKRPARANRGPSSRNSGAPSNRPSEGNKRSSSRAEGNKRSSSQSLSHPLWPTVPQWHHVMMTMHTNLLSHSPSRGPHSRLITDQSPASGQMMIAMMFILQWRLLKR